MDSTLIFFFYAALKPSIFDCLNLILAIAQNNLLNGSKDRPNYVSMLVLHAIHGTEDYSDLIICKQSGFLNNIFILAVLINRFFQCEYMSPVQGTKGKGQRARDKVFFVNRLSRSIFFLLFLFSDSLDQY